MEKGWDVSAVSFHKLMQSLFKLDAMNQWGSIVALTYIAAQRTFPNYNDMADNKAYLESIARSFGYFFGKEKNVRVNTISQSPTLTTAGKGVKGLDDFIKYADLTSPLGNATAEDCADLTVSLFSDYTQKSNSSNIFNDGGFSSVGVSQEIIDKIKFKMKIVGLTGGIGSGKSTVLNEFKDLGIKTYSADNAAKTLINTDKALIDSIKKVLVTISIKNKIDTKQLSKIVFQIQIN